MEIRREEVNLVGKVNCLVEEDMVLWLDHIDLVVEKVNHFVEEDMVL